MRAVENTLVASLNASEGKELNFTLIWPVSLVPPVARFSLSSTQTRRTR